MKILFIANTPNSRTTGIAKIMHHLRDEMIRAGHPVDALFGEDVLDPRLPRRLRDLLFPVLMAGPMMRLWKKAGGYDIVAVHSLEGGIYAVLRKLFRRLPPCVVVSYGSDEMRWELEQEEERLGLHRIPLHSKILYPLLRLSQTRLAIRYADHVMLTARTEIPYFQKKHGVPPARMTFIPNGVSPEYLKIRRDYRRNPKKLLYLGGWEWRKGIRYLAQGFEKAAARFPDLTLTLAGIGTSEARALSFFSPALHSRVRAIPKLSEPETVKAYADHDIFVFPTLFESMSLVVPEAMASAMPVVTTHVCGLPDIVTNEVDGLLIAPRSAEALAEKISLLVKDPDLCERLGAQARRRAETITWDKVAAQVLEMYQTVRA